MWPFSLLKKITKDPEVGQTQGDYIGCYLMGTNALQGEDDISYISLATSRDQLELEAREYLQGFLDEHPQLPATDRDSLQQLLARLAERIDTHLATASASPPLIQGGRALFLRTGMRARKKDKGVYLE